MEETFLTIRDKEGRYYPLAVIWPGNENQKYYQPDIDKYMKKASKEDMELVRVKLVEVK
jgi:hypothetical protein